MGRIHAPYTITDCLMTGTMHWVTTEMLKVMQLCIEEKVHAEITNEDPAYEFKDKTKRIEELWRVRAKPYEWGTDKELEEFSLLRQVRIDLAVLSADVNPSQQFLASPKLTSQIKKPRCCGCVKSDCSTTRYRCFRKSGARSCGQTCPSTSCQTQRVVENDR